jgi:hypothetical protein
MTAELTDRLDMTALCSNDQRIMDPSKIQQYTLEEQLDINLKRIHLQSVLLSDLTTGNRHHAQDMDGQHRRLH